jgi:hypothetical protein
MDLTEICFGPKQNLYEKGKCHHPITLLLLLNTKGDVPLVLGVLQEFSPSSQFLVLFILQG